MWNFIKYNLIGVVNTLITLMVVWVLYELLHWNLELSNFLGFVAGGSVTVISEICGNVIVNVKDSRVAVSKEMAQKIMV